MSYKGQKTFSTFVCFFFLLTLKSLAFTAPADSIGIEKQGNKTFILHKVEAKETLFSLSRRYHIRTHLIQEVNPDMKAGLKEGQIVRIPYLPKSTSASSGQGNGKNNKVHVVAAGQTLYSISRQYKVSVEDLKRWNNLSSNEVDLGQEIIVSSSQKTINTPEVVEKPKTDTNAVNQAVSDVPNFRYDSKGNKLHITEPGQTLYSIAQIYNASLEDIKNWNGITGNEISTGQQIIVERAKAKENHPNNNKGGDETNKPAGNNTSDVVTSNPPKKSDGPLPTENRPEGNKSGETSSAFNKVIHRGLAEAIDDSEQNPKFLALHKTAGVGTIIQVKNELNNLYIFARVIGKLPENSENEKLIIKLSQKAYDKLGAVDKRFPVEVSYVPND